MLALQSDLNGNCLLSALPSDEWKTVLPYLEFIPLSAKTVLCDYATPSPYLYFPTSCVVSWLASMEDGGVVEIASIGREGSVGMLEFVTGAVTVPYRAQVQISGMAYRIKSQDIDLERTPALYQIALLYLQSFFIQVAQTSACNRHHSLEQQLCRWLLVEFDHTQSNQLSLPQTAIADALGRRRESVTSAISELEEEGILGRAYMKLYVKNRSGLEAHSCECYRVMKGEFDRLCDYERFRAPISNNSRPSQLL